VITVLKKKRIDILIKVISVGVEFPLQSLKLFGQEEGYQKLVRSLTQEQALCNGDTGEVIETKLFTISGKYPNRTIRFYKKGLEVVKWFELYDLYIKVSNNHIFSGNQRIITRNHRVAEMLAFMARVQVKFSPMDLPILRSGTQTQILEKKPFFYMSKILKKVDASDDKKTIQTRMAGAFFYGNKCYAIYNTGYDCLEMDLSTECKAKLMLESLADHNTKRSGEISAMLFSFSPNVILDSIRKMDMSEKKRKKVSGKLVLKKYTFVELVDAYASVFYIPLDENGMHQFRFFMVDDFQEKLLAALYDPSQRAYGKGLFDYDAKVDGVYSVSFLDGNMSKLLRFRKETLARARRYEIICFDFQEQFLKELFGESVDIVVVSMDEAEEILNLKGESE